MLHKFLSQLLPRVKEFENIQELVRNDGYIVTWNKKSGTGDTDAPSGN